MKSHEYLILNVSHKKILLLDFLLSNADHPLPSPASLPHTHTDTLTHILTVSTFMILYLFVEVALAGLRLNFVH